MTNESIIAAAKIANEAVRSYQKTVSLKQEPRWAFLDKKAKLELCKRVERAIGGSFEEQHEVWRAKKFAEGWTYGEGPKASKLLAKYDDLPLPYRTECELFYTVAAASVKAIDKMLRKKSK